MTKKRNDTSQISLKNNIIANIIGKGSVLLSTMVLVPFLLAFLGEEGYGLIGLYLSFLVFFQTLATSFGTGFLHQVSLLNTNQTNHTEIRDLSLTFEIIYWILSFLLLILFISIAPFVAGSWLHSNILSVTTLKNTIYCIGIIFFLQIPVCHYFSGLNGLQRQFYPNLILTASSTLQVIGGIFILWKISNTLQAYFMWLIFAKLLEVTVSRYVFWKKLPGNSQPRIRPELLRKCYKMSFGVGSASFLSILLLTADKLILSGFFDLKTFGYYTIAWHISSCVLFFSRPFYISIFPRFSEIVSMGDTKQLIPLYHKVCRLLSCSILPVVLIVCLFHREILFAWLGNDIALQQIYLAIIMLAIGSMLKTLMVIPFAAQLAYEWTSLAVILSLIQLIVLVPLLLFMINIYGLNGAAFVWLFLNLLNISLGLFFMHRKILQNELGYWLINDFCFPILTCLLPVLILKGLMPHDPGRFFTILYLCISLLITWFIAGIMNPEIRRFISSLKKPLKNSDY